MYRRQLLILLAVLWTMAFITTAHAQLPQISSGLSYLTSSQNTDGTWSTGTSQVETTAATISALETLKLLTQTAGSSYTTGISWLQAQSPQSVDYIAERIHALNLTDGTPLIPSLDTLGGGWGGYEGYETNPLDTSLALQALKSANYSDQSIIFTALNFLVSTQNPDGGWGFTKDDASNVFVTANVLSTLAQYKNEFLAETQVGKAVAFLFSRQNPDCGIGTGASTVYETALAFSAIVDSGQTQGLPLQNAISYLTASQLANGSWNDDPYSTALALQALARVKPDLTLAASDINVSPATPAAGNSVAITATIRNIGLETAGNITVRLTDNGTTVAEQTISAISPGGTAQAAFAIPAITPYGDHSLSIVIDPANAIDELNETNNTASTRIWAKSAADLVVYPEYLAISPDAPKPGDTITLTAMVANMGESAAQNVTATLYDGDPASGVTLGSFTIAAIDSGSWGNGTVSFALTAVGSHNLTLVVDPQHLITEEIRSNNRAVKTVTVTTGGAAHSVDLNIPPTGLQITPSRPRAGESVTVTVTAQNLGNSSATADLELFDGDPASGILLHRSTLALSGGETRTVSVPWTVGAGIHTLKAYLDRAALVTETDKLNNSRTLTVMADMVDIEISASDIAITPEHPMAGDPATVKVTVQNRGILPTGPFTVNLYNGDPAAGGVILQSFEIAGLAGDASQELIYPFTAVRGTYRFYAVCDPDNRVAEMYEENNLAIRSLLVKSSAEAKGPDLSLLEFDLSATLTDPQSLRISGFAKVKFLNKGDDKVATPFRITVFEDRDGDGLYTEGTDQALGFWDYTSPLNPGMVATVSVNLFGAVIFRDSPIYATLDSAQAVFEQDKSNNTIRRGFACEARPITPIEPVLKWQWPGTSAGFQALRILTLPIVSGVTDNNGDGRIDRNDVPTILINAPLMSDQQDGIIWALRGDTGAQLFSMHNPDHKFSSESYLVSADIDNDGKPEIVAGKRLASFVNGGNFPTVAFENDGTLKWDNTASVLSWGSANPYSTVNTSDAAHPAIADLDGDGVPEIIAGSIAVLNADGSVRCSPDKRGIFGGQGGVSGGFTGTPLVVDLDMDGKPEILGGNVAYNADCTVKWQNSAIPDGLTAIGNFDDDPYPEIILVTAGWNLQYTTYTTKVWMLDHSGSVKWGPIYISQLEGIYNEGPGGFPIVADFDGDGKPEIGVRGVSNYLILDKDGRLKRMLPMGAISYSEMRISPTVFDLNGDGRPEILINAGGNFKIFDGTNGTLLFQEYAGGGYDSVSQNVIVADVDGNGHAEVIVSGAHYGNGQVLVYRAKNNDWVNTSRVWNQDTYHVTNVSDYGSIPKNESPSWLLNNNYRCNVPTTLNTNPYLAPDLSASYVRIDMADFPRSVAMTARIGNGGAKAATPGVLSSFYDGDPASGGGLIGSAVTSRPLGPGEYEDVTLIWSAPAEGSHTLQVVTNDGNSQSECDKSNNSVTLPVYVSSGKPDPGIASGDIIASSSIPEGSLTDILVTVRNIGTLRVDNVMVRLYNGNPAQGGKQIGGDRVVTTIAAGGAVTLTTTWSTLGAKGVNYIYAVVDPNATTADVNRGNNIAMKELLVTAAEKPDLFIGGGDITITPVALGEGDILNISALIRNLGVQVANVKVALYDANPVLGGIKRGEAQIPRIIPAGGSAAVTFSLDTIGLAGNHTFYVKVDPDNAIDESNKANNQASRNVTILTSGVTLNLSTDKGEYGANEAVRLIVTIGNSRAEERNLSYNIQLLDKTGAYAATVSANTALHMSANAANASILEWNTGTTYSGAYTAALQVSENGRTIAKVVTPINILPVKKADVRVFTDKAAYGVNEQVAISATVTGTSPNFILSALISRTTVIDSAGQTLFTETDNISSLMLGQRIELKHYWNSGTKSKGIYSLKLELFEGGVAIASAQTEFSIKGTAESGAGLTGVVSLQPATVEAGNSVTLSFSVANRGNEDIANLLLTLLIADPESGQVLKTMTGIADGALAINATQIGDIPLSTTGFTPKTLLAILQSTLQGVTKNIAKANFTIVDTIPPVLTVSTLSDNSYTNQEALNVSGTVHDNSGTAQVEINGVSVPVSADGSFNQVLLLKSADNAVEVKAIDMAGNKAVDSRIIHFDKTAPLLFIDSPADNSKTAVSPIEVKGSVDETSSVTIKLSGVIQPVIMDGNRFLSAIILEPRWNTIEITATDLAGNPSSQKRSVLFDDQKPSLSITEPDHDIRTNKNILTISGKASDPYSAVGVTVAIDGAILTPQVIGDSFSQVVTFTDEKLYPITITASNEVGTQTTVQRNIIFDKTPPNLTIDPVVTPTNTASQTVSGTRDDGALLTVTCATATAGAVEYPTATTWRAAVSGLSLGENRLQAESYDLAGNRGVATATILYVPKAPDVTISASPNQLWPPNKKLVPVVLNGSVITYGSGIREMSISVADEYGVYNQQGLRFGDTVLLEAWRNGNDMDGRVYTVTVVVTDQAGNVTTRSATVVVPHDMRR